MRADWATKILWTASEKSAELPAANAAMSEGSKAKLLETNRFQDPLDDVERTFLSPAVANKKRASSNGSAGIPDQISVRMSL